MSDPTWRDHCIYGDAAHIFVPISYLRDDVIAVCSKCGVTR